MNIFQGFILGLIQGVGEFLPISSSGHLSLAENLLGLGDTPLIFDLFLHIATLLAVCIFFRKKIWNLLCCFGRWITKKQKKENRIGYYDDILCNTEEQGHKTIIAIIIATFVTAIIGLFVDKLLPYFSLKFISGCFIVTALMLILSSMIIDGNQYKKEVSKKNNVITAKKAIIIGIMQGFGTIPGISRSGSTISAALFCNIDSKTAGDFSFILSIPSILGAFILKLKDIEVMNEAINILPLIVGFITSFVVGYFSLKFLMNIIRKGKLSYFAFYLIPLGLLGLILF